MLFIHDYEFIVYARWMKDTGSNVFSFANLITSNKHPSSNTWQKEWATILHYEENLILFKLLFQLIHMNLQLMLASQNSYKNILPSISWHKMFTHAWAPFPFFYPIKFCPSFMIEINHTKTISPCFAFKNKNTNGMFTKLPLSMMGVIMYDYNIYDMLIIL